MAATTGWAVGPTSTLRMRSTRIANFYFDYKVFFYWGMAQWFAPCFLLGYGGHWLENISIFDVNRKSWLQSTATFRVVEAADRNQQILLTSLKPLTAINTYIHVTLGPLIAVKGYFQLPLDVLIPDSMPAKCKDACWFQFIATFCFKTSQKLASKSFFIGKNYLFLTIW